MMRMGGHVLRFTALWVALGLSQMIAGMLLWSTPDVGAEAVVDAEETLSLGQALLVVNTVYALMAAWLAARSRYSRVGRFATLFVILFGVRSAMSYSDLLFFGGEFNLDALDLPRLIAMEALVVLAVSATAAVIYPLRSAHKAPAATVTPMGATAWTWRLAATTALYVAAYWTAGIFIAWGSPAVAEFYGGEEFLASVDWPALLAFQVLRGLAWSGLVLLVLASHRGALLERALAAATTVAALLAVLLLYPTDLMPEAVRYAHMFEIAVSNMAWGLAASVLLAPLADGMRAPRGRVPRGGEAHAVGGTLNSPVSSRM